MGAYADLIPIHVLTGFLGSGKTTVLKHLLQSPRLQDTAVLVNEFGEVGLDHHLIEHASESTLLLDNGCLCCAVRGDLQVSLRDLLERRERGEIPRFERVVIETSGLADPVPIAYTVLADPMVQHHYRLGNILTVVDAVNTAAGLSRFPESEKQVLTADHLLISKLDLADAEDPRALLARLNPSARISDASDLDPAALLADDLYTAAGKKRAVDQWRDAAANGAADDHHHSDGVTSFCLTFDAPLDWSAFGIWMTMLLNRHGEKVLRIKGMLNVAGLSAPVLVNGVQHIVHPPTHLEAWPDEDRRSRLIFITREMAREPIEASLLAFNALANKRAA